MTATETTTGIVPVWELGDRLRKALEESEVAIQHMADVLRVSRGTVSNYIHGRTTPNYATLEIWARETGVSLEWLQTGQPIIHVEFWCNPCQMELPFDIPIPLRNGWDRTIDEVLLAEFSRPAVAA